MFLHVCVILFTGGVSGQPPPGPGRHPPQAVRGPPDQADPPGTRQTPPPDKENPPHQADPPRRRLQHPVNERPVRILLECILVSYRFLEKKKILKRKFSVKVILVYLAPWRVWILYASGRVWVEHLSSAEGHRRLLFWWWSTQFLFVFFIYANEWWEKSHCWDSDWRWWQWS